MQPKAFNPEMLILARESRGMTQKELAERAHISQSRISKLEDGIFVTPPDDALLMAFSLALNYPVNFFSQTGTPRVAAAYRRRSTVPTSILNQCEARVNVQRLQIEKLFLGSDFETKDLPFIDPDECPGGAPEVAQRVRRLWNIPRGPIKNLTKLVEDAGCIVVHFEFGTKKMNGLRMWADKNRPIIFLNPSFPPDSMRLSLAEEFGHTVMHRVETPNMEAEAKSFASEFLMPKADIASSFYPLSIDHLARLKLKWHVSMQALLHRAQELGAVKERYARYLWMELGRAGYRTSEPHQNLMTFEPPSLLAEMIDLHLGELGYSPDELAQALAMSRSEFENIYLSLPGHLRVVK